MNTPDIILSIFLLFGAYEGYKKGILIELITLAGLVLAVAGGFIFMDKGNQWLAAHFDTNSIAEITPYISFLGIFALILWVSYLLGSGFKKVIDVAFIGTIDNLLGGIVGLLKWAAVLSVLIWLAEFLKIDAVDRFFEDSKIFPYIRDLVPMVVAWMSKFWPAIQESFDSIKQFINEKSSDFTSR